MAVRTTCVAVTLSLALSITGGCGVDSPAVTPSSPGAAELPVPPGVRTLGVIGLVDGGRGVESSTWTVEDELLTLLTDLQRYELKGPLWSEAGSTAGDAGQSFSPDTARMIGRSMGVDAVLYVATTVAISETSPPEPETSALVRSSGSGPQVTCRVTARFALDEVARGATIAAVLLTKESKGFSRPGDAARGGREMAHSLLRQCAREFVAMISP